MTPLTQFTPYPVLCFPVSNYRVERSALVFLFALDAPICLYFNSRSVSVIVVRFLREPFISLAAGFFFRFRSPDVPTPDLFGQSLSSPKAFEVCDGWPFLLVVFPCLVQLLLDRLASHATKIFSFFSFPPRYVLLRSSFESGPQLGGTIMGATSITLAFPYSPF